MCLVLNDQDAAHLRLSRERLPPLARSLRTGVVTRGNSSLTSILYFSGALGEDATAVPLGDRADDVEAEPGALHFRSERLEAVEAVEDASELGARNADAGVPDANPRRVGRRARGLHGDQRRSARILHRVVEEVGDRRAQLVDVAVDYERIDDPIDDSDGVSAGDGAARRSTPFLPSHAIDRRAMLEGRVAAARPRADLLHVCLVDRHPSA